MHGVAGNGVADHGDLANTAPLGEVMGFCVLERPEAIELANPGGAKTISPLRRSLLGASYTLYVSSRMMLQLPQTLGKSSSETPLHPGHRGVWWAH